jgi:hypothetical protein
MSVLQEGEKRIMAKRYRVYLSGHIDVYASSKEDAEEAAQDNLDKLHQKYNMEIMTTKIHYDFKPEGTI